YDASGTKLTDDEIANQIKVGAVVAMSADCEPVAASYLAALAKDTLVIVSPEYAVNNVVQPDRAPDIPAPGAALVPSNSEQGAVYPPIYRDPARGFPLAPPAYTPQYKPSSVTNGAIVYPQP